MKLRLVRDETAPVTCGHAVAWLACRDCHSCVWCCRCTDGPLLVIVGRRYGIEPKR